MGVGLQGRVHLACPCVLRSGLSSWRGAPCGLPRAQGPTDCRSSGAETLVSTGAAGQRSSTADPPSCHGGPAGPAANAGGAWPWARPAALAGQGLGASQRGRFPLPSGFELQPGSGLCRPSACSPRPASSLTPCGLAPAAPPTSPPPSWPPRQVLSSTHAAVLVPSALTPAWCFSDHCLLQVICVSAALWSLPGAAPFPARPCLPPDHNLRAWCGLVCCQLAPFVPREPGTSRQGRCRAGLFPRGSACGRLSLPSRAQGCAQWNGLGRSPPLLSCTPLLASELGKCPLGWDSGVQRTEACRRPTASAIVLSRILSQQSWALRRSPRVCGEGFPRAGQV